MVLSTSPASTASSISVDWTDTSIFGPDAIQPRDTGRKDSYGLVRSLPNPNPNSNPIPAPASCPNSTSTIPTAVATTAATVAVATTPAAAGGISAKANGNSEMGVGVPGAGPAASAPELGPVTIESREAGSGFLAGLGLGRLKLHKLLSHNGN